MSLRLLAIVILLPVLAYPQERTDTRTVLKGMASVGLVTGEAKSGIALHYGTGLRRGQFYAGIGAGYDNYTLNSFPIYLDLRAFTGKRKNLFGYLNGGINVAARFKKEEMWGEGDNKMKAGLYMDLGAGFRIPLSKEGGISLSLGYTRKNLDHVITYYSFCATSDCVPRIDRRETTRYQFARVVARVVVDWNY